MLGENRVIRACASALFQHSLESEAGREGLESLLVVLEGLSPPWLTSEPDGAYRGGDAWVQKRYNLQVQSVLKALTRVGLSSAVVSGVSVVVGLLSRRRKLHLLPKVYRYVRELLLCEQGFLPLIVVTARAMPEEAAKALEEKLSGYLGKPSLDIAWELDAELLSGYCVIWGDWVLDLSAKEYLRRLKALLASHRQGRIESNQRGIGIYGHGF